jgi:hypothetical protein
VANKGVKFSQKDRGLVAKAKILHGEGKGGREIAQAVGKDVKTVQVWIKEWREQGFEKGFLGSLLDQEEEAAKVAERQKKGLDEGRVEAKLLKLMEAKKPVFFQGVKVTTVPDNATQLGATSLAMDKLGMKKFQGQAVLEAGIYAFYREKLASKRAKK